VEIGRQLRVRRDERMLTLEKVAARTRIPLRILDAIERDDLQAVPSGIFLRGYLRAYARELGLDPEALVAQYRIADPPLPSTPVTERSSGSAENEGLTARLAAIPREYAFVGLLIAITVAVTYLRPALPSPPARETFSDAKIQTAQAAIDEDTQTDRVAVEPRAADAGGSSAAAVKKTASDPIRVTLTATDTAWVDARVDSRRAMYRLLNAKEDVSLTGNRISLRIGNAGAVLVSVDGERAVPSGELGKVRTMEIARGADGRIAR
jgi:cytoskeletal protein RodZ